MNRYLVPVAIASVVVVALQWSLLSSLRLGGAVIMLVWLWPLALGLVGASEAGIMAGVITGVLFDAHTTTPFGLTAVAGAAMAYGASRLGREGVGDLDSAAFWVGPVLAAAGGTLTPVLYCLLGVVVLDTSLWRGGMVASMTANALAFTVLARPTMRVARWLSGTTTRRRR